ncbi:MAG: hypothetical protein Q7K57_57205 [Burkholderiaceae bacterium]|nr:hypothetical protein [Burkholderiaceae bacterium]
MPQVVAYIGASLMMSGVAEGVGAFLLSYATVIGTAAVLIGGMAYSASKERSAKQDAKDQYNAAQVDRLINVSSSIAPRELVLGRVRKGGVVFYKASTGTVNRNLIMAIALGGNELDAIEDIYLNDTLVTLDGNGYVQTAPYANASTQSHTVNTGAGYTATLPADYHPGTVSGTAVIVSYDNLNDGETSRSITVASAISIAGLTVTAAYPGTSISYQSSSGASYVRITKHLGGAGQVVDPDLLSLFPADWSAANTVQGVPYLLVNMVYDETAFPSGAPNVTAVVRGAKLYDPRTGLTAWSENPALMLRHVYQHPKFGKAAITAQEDARIVTAANACDQSTVYTMGGVAQAACALYRGSLVLPFGTATKSAFDDLSQAMGGSWAFAGGALYLKAGVYTASVMSLSDADLAVVQRNGAGESQQPISISVHKERAQKFNTVKVKIWDQAQDYKQVSLSPLVGILLLTRDGVELTQEVCYPAIGYAPQALHVAGVMMRDARDALVVDLPFKLRAYPLELFDTVDLTLSRYGWSAKTFMILSRTWNANGALQLTLKETTAAIVQVDAGFPAQGFASNTNLPKPWVVAAVGPLTISTGTAELIKQQDGTVSSRMRISWPQIVDAAVLQNGNIEVQYRRSDSSGAWASLVAQGAETQVVTSEVQDGAFYIVRARAKTTLAVGDWCAQVQVQVIGKTEPPADVASLTLDGDKLSWPAVADIDLSGYLVRYQYGTNLEWGTAIPMSGGMLTSSPYTMLVKPPGRVTIMVRAVDTTGNESMRSAYVITDLGDSLVANVLESYDYRAAAWPGTLANASLVGGDLQATQSDQFYGADASDFYSLGGALFYSTNYDAMEWISAGWTPSLAASGSNMTAAWVLTGDAVNIQYRPTGPSQFYAAGDATFYGADAEQFYDSAPNWMAWPGSVIATNQEYQWRVTTKAGAASGLLSAFAVSVDVPDKTLKLNAVAISAGGTRLTGAIGLFNVIQNIQLTLQGGSTAVLLEIQDYSITLGPLITAKNAAGTGVTATIDALLQGY